MHAKRFYRIALAIMGVVAIIGFFFYLSANPVPSISPAAVIVSQSEKPEATALPEYVEVTEGCSWDYQGACVLMRSGPDTMYPIVLPLRTGIVLKVASTTIYNGRTWYKIAFDPSVRYPERITNDWYVAGDIVQPFLDTGDQVFTEGASISSTKKIIVSRSKQMLYAYDGDVLFMEEPVSTGLELTPTPRGTFTVYKKTPTRYMQGPLPGISDQYYDLPGVPWNLYFTLQGGVIHGAYWHDRFGQPWSHGCVNLPPEEAKKLYKWADLGTIIIVQD